MTDVQAMVAEFHGAFDLPNRLGQGKPNAMHERTELRWDLIGEEYREFVHEHDERIADYAPDGGPIFVPWVRDTANYAKELADLVIVSFGAAIEAGIDLNMVLGAVHASNMSKLGEDGKPIYREDGKVLKGPNYSAPNIKEVLGLD